MKIALICAHPDLANSGMLSVDLAFESLKKYFKSDVEFTRFCSWKDINRSGSVPINYQKLENLSDLENFDKIIYWGDFLHWIKYGPSFMSGKGTEWYANQNNISVDKARELLIEKWYSMYLLENRSDLQKKAIVFGGTIYGINSNQLVDNRYKTAISSLYQNAQLVLMRDYVSAFYVSQLFDDKRFSYGCDCALFLETTEKSTTTTTEESYMVYSFGRCKMTPELEKFAQEIAEKANLKAVKISWLHPQTNINGLLNNLEIIKKSQFAITDIYHFAINCWRENIPTITIGQGSSYPSQGTLSDKKKEVFNTQILAMNYYFYLENILSNKEKQMQNIVSQIKDKNSLNIVLDNIKFQIDYSKKRLIESINQ
jgi:hypothetical protein